MLPQTKGSEEEKDFNRWTLAISASPLSLCVCVLSLSVHRLLLLDSSLVLAKFSHLYKDKQGALHSVSTEKINKLVEMYFYVLSFQ